MGPWSLVPVHRGNWDSAVSTIRLFGSEPGSLFGAAAVPVGRLAATAVANRPTASPAEAACALGVVWGHVLWL